MENAARLFPDKSTTSLMRQMILDAIIVEKVVEGLVAVSGSLGIGHVISLFRAKLSDVVEEIPLPV